MNALTPAWTVAAEDDCVSQWLANLETSTPGLAPIASDPDRVEDFIDHLDPPQPARVEVAAQLTVEAWLREPAGLAGTTTRLETIVERGPANAEDLYQALQRLDEVLGGIEKRCADLAARRGSR